MNTNEHKSDSPRRSESSYRGFRLRPCLSRFASDRQLRTGARKKAREGDYAGAIALLNQLLKRHPGSAVDYNNRGLMYFYQGQLFQALEDYDRAIALNARLDQAYNNRANCHAFQGQLVEALMDYEISLDLNPANLRTWMNQGITFRELGLYDLALDNFELALRWGRQLQGRIYAERGHTYHLRGDWNSAIADYRRALTQLPPTPNSYREKVEGWLKHLLPSKMA